MPLDSDEEHIFSPSFCLLLLVPLESENSTKGIGVRATDVARAFFFFLSFFFLEVDEEGLSALDLAMLHGQRMVAGGGGVVAGGGKPRDGSVLWLGTW